MLRATSEFDHSASAFAPAIAARNIDLAAPALSLARNELLFETGDVKTNVYRVERGVLCIYVTRPDLTLEVIEFALAGDLVGMGFLERHACNARATVETKVTCIPLDAADQLIAHDERAKARFHDAVEREFAFRRDSIVNAGRERPLARVAAFLIAVSRRNRDEGLDPTFVDDASDYTVVADFLSLSVDLLALALVQLEMRGLIQLAPCHGLRLTNLDGLEALAREGLDEPSLQSELAGHRKPAH